MLFYGIFYPMSKVDCKNARPKPENLGKKQDLTPIRQKTRPDPNERQKTRPDPNNVTPIMAYNA